MDAHNDFEAPDVVQPEAMTAGLTHDAHQVTVTIPPMSVVTVHVQ
jgi:alpha-N-arabinofuranosidase